MISGTQIIQDLRTYFNTKGLPYNGEHRIDATAEHGRDFAVHDVTNGAADASRFMDYDKGLCYFRALINCVKVRK